jgi:hypothetical protein
MARPVREDVVHALLFQWQDSIRLVKHTQFVGPSLECGHVRVTLTCDCSRTHVSVCGEAPLVVDALYDALEQLYELVKDCVGPSRTPNFGSTKKTRLKWSEWGTQFDKDVYWWAPPPDSWLGPPGVGDVLGILLDTPTGRVAVACQFGVYVGALDSAFVQRWLRMHWNVCMVFCQLHVFKDYTFNLFDVATKAGTPLPALVTQFVVPAFTFEPDQASASWERDAPLNAYAIRALGMAVVT